MKRLTAYLKGKVENIKAANREKRVASALNAATINFEEERDDAKMKIDELTESLADCDDVQKVISKISEQMDIISRAEKGLQRIKEISAYFNEEVEVKE